jgi:hypothetical protein
MPYIRARSIDTANANIHLLIIEFVSFAAKTF